MRHLVRLRHALHGTPEAGLRLPLTQRRILDELSGLGMSVSVGEQLSSVTSVLHGCEPGPTVLLRADMDALALPEGVMHACGHDLHMTMLVGAARLLREATFPGSVIFMFQPGEEGCGGAELMIREGVLDAAGERPVAAYAVHVVASMLPNGFFVSRPGIVLGASDTLRLTVRGRGGHSAMPHAASSPIPAACAIVGAVQETVTATVDPFEPVVATVTSVHAGEADNAIPDNATVTLSLRSYSDKARLRTKDRLIGMACGVAAASGVELEVRGDDGYPVTRNDARETALAASVVHEVFGPGRYHESPRPLPMSEDFAYVLDQVPGAFVFLGACAPGADPAAAAPNHSPRAVFDDSVLEDGARFYAELALRRLRATSTT
jgi:amidohydrolase